MAMDPTRRLRRRVPGDDLAPDERGLARLLARDAPDTRRDPVPPRDKAGVRVPTQRDTTRVASCRPNAPLLIRIVRYPFALATTRGSRQKYRGEVDKFIRIDWSAEVAAALAERQRLRFTSAGRGRPLPFTVRPSTWSLLPPDPYTPKPGDKR
ncbi:MAG: hypothetical protein Q8P41_04660 [Pseudomonadota bacterium]|nr:hypothetical protein [Pseudomonadota bacterium]